jgi:hypothetical protein
MSQPPLPTVPLSPLFSEDAEPDGSPTHAPTVTFYGARQIFPPPQELSSRPARTAPPQSQPQPRGGPPTPPHDAPLPSPTPRRNDPSPARVPQPATPQPVTPRSDPPRSQAAPVPQSKDGGASDAVPDSVSAAAAPISAAVLDRFPITAAWLSGALVGVIAHSLARGDVWKIGPLQEATGPHILWLRPGTSHEFQVAAWLVIPTTPVLGS